MFFHRVISFCAAVGLFISPFSALPHTAQAANAENWQLISQVGGKTQSLTIFGQTLFLGVGMHVEIFDISDASQMRWLGASPLLPDFVENLTTADGKTLYAACGSGGIQILDVSNPSSPVMIGSMNTLGFTEDLLVSGNILLTADGPNGIQIFDISDTSKPTPISQAYSGAYVYDLQLNGSALYAAGGGSGLLVVDIKDIKKPVEKGILNLNGFTYQIAISGTRLFTASAWGDMAVVDITDPLAPKVQEYVEIPGWAMAVDIRGSQALVMSGIDGVRKFDINAQTPKLVGTAYTKDIGFAQFGVLQADNAFVIDAEKGLLDLSFSSIGAPVLKDQYFPILDARRVTMSGTTAYVAAGLGGMRAIDLSDPTHPKQTAWFDTKRGYANKVIASDKYAYLSTHLDAAEGLSIFDISTSTQPLKISGLIAEEFVYNGVAFRSIAKSGNTILVAGEWNDVAIDVSDPKKPVLASVVPNENVNAAAMGDILVEVSNNQVRTLSFSDPYTMQQLGTFNRDAGGEGIAFYDQNTILVSADQGIMALDISKPAAMKKLSNLKVPGETVFEIFIVGQRAYMSALGNGIHIVDLTNLGKLELIGTVETTATATDVFVKDDLMLVADTQGGLTIYRRGSSGTAMQSFSNTLADVPITVKSLFKNQDVAGLMGGVKPVLKLVEPETGISTPANASNCVVTSTADEGVGSLRTCLETISDGTVITFDPVAFPTKKPTTIMLKSPLPVVDQKKNITIDASNAGVILNGSQLEGATGLDLYVSNSKVMGLQFLNFDNEGLRINGDSNIIGGSRLNGSAPTGEGVLIGNSGPNGMHINGNKNVVKGSFIGVDSSGTKVLPNYYGLFISDSAEDCVVGGVNPGEGNIISGNSSTNLLIWAKRTRVIGNIIGLDINGTRAMNTQTERGLCIENRASNNVLGGTSPEERNIISGAQMGVVFSDWPTYQNSLIGNYIGTDISGMKAVPNQNGIVVFVVSHNRIGGTARGEGNLISGNQRAINVNGTNAGDNIIIGNSFGLDADGKPTLPNKSGIGIDTGQTHNIIGGFTPAEANVISGGDIALTLSGAGIINTMVIGNTFSGASIIGVYFNGYANRNFVQGNNFSALKANLPAMRVDYGTRNLLRGNIVAVDPSRVIDLLENGNLELAAPVITAATAYSVAGTACSGCLVEMYAQATAGMQPVGSVRADAQGAFVFQTCTPFEGQKVSALAIDATGNTSFFAGVVMAVADSTAKPAGCP